MAMALRSRGERNMTFHGAYGGAVGTLDRPAPGVAGPARDQVEAVASPLIEGEENDEPLTVGGDAPVQSGWADSREHGEPLVADRETEEDTGAEDEVELDEAYEALTAAASVGRTPVVQANVYDLSQATDDIAQVSEWRCSNCGTLNPADAESCGVCGSGARVVGATERPTSITDREIPPTLGEPVVESARGQAPSASRNGSGPAPVIGDAVQTKVVAADVPSSPTGSGVSQLRACLESARQRSDRRAADVERHLATAEDALQSMRDEWAALQSLAASLSDGLSSVVTLAVPGEEWNHVFAADLARLLGMSSEIVDALHTVAAAYARAAAASGREQ